MHKVVEDDGDISEEKTSNFKSPKKTLSSKNIMDYISNYNKRLGIQNEPQMNHEIQELNTKVKKWKAKQERSKQIMINIIKKEGEDLSDTIFNKRK